jgi:hypothetical protein
MRNNFFFLKKFWKNKKVFLTGHTGFKGGWFSIFLNLLGAKIVGYSLRPEQKNNLFDLANLNKQIQDILIHNDGYIIMDKNVDIKRYIYIICKKIKYLKF